jgi:hypothetical protein
MEQRTRRSATLSPGSYAATRRRWSRVRRQRRQRQPALRRWGRPITLTATASSGLPVSYASPTRAVCKVSGSKATVIAPGTCTIQATRAGSQTYSAATPVAQSFTVLSASAYFTITPLPAAETVDRGVIGVFIQLNSVNGFAGNVTLGCSGGPVGSTCTDFPVTVKLKGTAYALYRILFPRNATPGTYVITFTGVSGSLIRSATAKFTVKQRFREFPRSSGRKRPSLWKTNLRGDGRSESVRRFPTREQPWRLWRSL